MINKPYYDITAKWMGEERRNRERRGAVPVDGMTADASTRNLLAGIVLAITITASVGIIFVSVYALRYKINHFFRQHGINIEIAAPYDARSLRR